jgi:two-component system chemotaxis response regulator CheY
MDTEAAPELWGVTGPVHPAGGSRVPQAKPIRVLVVDDDAANRALCSLTLQSAGYDVLEAEDGQRGLELARSEDPDLALLDVRMPRLDGFELGEALRADTQTRAIPVVFVSAEADPASYARARALGAAGYLPKPFDPRRLESLVGLVAGDRVWPSASFPKDGNSAWPDHAASH